MPKVSVTLSPAQYEELKAYARAHEISKEEVLRRALEQFLAQERSLDESLARTDMLPESSQIIGPEEYMDLDLSLPGAQ